MAPRNPSRWRSPWIAGTEREAIKARHGASSFEVKTVGHWVSPAWQPGFHAGEPDPLGLPLRRESLAGLGNFGKTLPIPGKKYQGA